jgi:hypothetical protein
MAYDSLLQLIPALRDFEIDCLFQKVILSQNIVLERPL